MYGLDGVKAVRLSEEGDVLTVRFEDYRGLYYVSTLPPRAPVRIRVKDRPDVLTFVGPTQLPLDTAGLVIDPSAHPSYFVSDHPPGPRATKRPALRLWWRAKHGDKTPENSPPLLERELRRGGFIR